MDSKKKIIILVFSLLLIMAVVLLVWFVFKPNKTNKRPVQLKNVPTAAQIEAAKRKSFNEKIDQTHAVDKDFDGILDKDEVKYKTSSTSADTDNDGLLDRDEIFKYKTDPTKADTDGDGYTDGQEVRYGYNPKGEGLLEQ